VSNELRAKHPEVAWGGMIGMRHVLVHGYFETDKDLVWRVVEQDIPTLKSQIEKKPGCAINLLVNFMPGADFCCLKACPVFLFGPIPPPFPSFVYAGNVRPLRSG
jgi:hypothetical protein